MTPHRAAAETLLSRSVRGSRVVITGAAGGIGRAACCLFASEGATVAVIDIDGPGAAATAATIAGQSGAAQPYTLDVSDAAAVRETIAAAAAALGGIDIIVNNAGISRLTPIDDPDYALQWDRHLAVLLTSQQLVIRAALPHLRRSAAPRIVNIASTEGLGATAQLSAYAAAKAGVIGLTRSLAVELGREAITVNCICPGPVTTGMTDAIPDDQKSAYAARRTALRRYADPMEIAHMILSIALPAAAFLTGAIIPVDGGLTARNG